LASAFAAALSIMEAFLLSHEAPVRLGVFLAAFAGMAAWEPLARGARCSSAS